MIDWTDKDPVWQAMHAAGGTIDQCADAIGVSWSTMQHRARELGYSFAAKCQIDWEAKDPIWKQMQDNGATALQAAAAIGASEGSVARRARKLGRPFRHRTRPGVSTIDWASLDLIWKQMQRDGATSNECANALRVGRGGLLRHARAVGLPFAPRPRVYEVRKSRHEARANTPLPPVRPRPQITAPVVTQQEWQARPEMPHRTRVCLWTDGERGDYRFCPEPATCGPFCSAHATVGLTVHGLSVFERAA